MGIFGHTMTVGNRKTVAEVGSRDSTRARLILRAQLDSLEFNAPLRACALHHVDSTVSSWTFSLADIHFLARWILTRYFIRLLGASRLATPRQERHVLLWKALSYFGNNLHCLDSIVYRCQRRRGHFSLWALVTVVAAPQRRRDASQSGAPAGCWPPCAPTSRIHHLVDKQSIQYTSGPWSQSK